MPELAERSLLSPLELPEFRYSGAEYYQPPAYFFEVPRSDDYYGAIEAMLLDDQVSSALGLRKRTALSAFPWRWSDATPPPARALLDEQLRRLTWEHDLEDALRCLDWGHAPCEQVWVRDAQGRLWIDRIEARDPRRFRVHRDGGLLYQGADLRWERVPDYRVAWYTHGATRENPYGRSALEPAFPRWQGKWKAMAQLERLGEKYSIPPVIALSDASDDEELNRISARLAELENGMGVALSGVTSIVQLSVAGKVEELLRAIGAHDDAISKVITAQVQLLDDGEGGGSYAKAKTHENSLEAVALLDFRATIRKLSRTTLTWLLHLNQVQGPAEMEFDQQTHREQKQAADKAEQASAEDGIELADGGDHLSIWV
jgi:hypothetical protein